MKKISGWAKKNPWKSRCSIAILYLLIPAFGLLMGGNVLMLGFQITRLLLTLSVTIFLIAVLYYPDKKQKYKSPFTVNFYNRQKACDWLLAFSSFLIFGFIGNSSNNSLVLSSIPGDISSTAAALAPVPIIAYPDKDKKPAFKIKTTRAERKAILKELKKLLKESFRGPKQTDPNSAARIGLVILAIIAGVGLSILLAALACNLSCAGSETGAVLLLVFGAGAIATLLVLTIRAIFKRYPRRSVRALSPDRST